MKNLFKKINWPETPQIPKTLQPEFERKLQEAADLYGDFLLKYVGWVLYLIFASVDFFSKDEKRYQDLLLRLSIIPISTFLYLGKDRFFKNYKKLRITLIWVFAVIVLAILYFTVSPRLLYPYAFGVSLASVTLLIFLPVTVFESILILLGTYAPMFIAILFRNFDLPLIIFAANTAIGISFSLICNTLLRRRGFVIEFLAREQFKNAAAIGENISHISHDTRAPLLALRVLKDESFEEKQGKEILNQSIGRLIELVEDITQAASSLQTNVQKHDLKAFLEECQEYILFLHPKIPIEWKFNFRDQTYFFDRNKIKRVLVNLINNAVKASSGTSQPIEVISTLNERLEIKVIDHGPGFDNNSDIFKKGVSFLGGTGLGLHFCRQVVEDHGGNISGVHEGGVTTFTFRI